MKAGMPALANVLIYDSDTRGRETLVYGFEGDGVKAAAAVAADELSTLLSAHRPQIVVVTLREDKDEDSQGAVAFLRSLAEAEETRSMPCLVLGPGDTLPEELRALLGGISFIALPAFVRDVITACKLLVSGSPSTGEEGQSELKGTLSDYGLYFVVRTMVGLARSGIVQVERGNRKGGDPVLRRRRCFRAGWAAAGSRGLASAPPVGGRYAGNQVPSRGAPGPVPAERRGVARRL